jgi:hypothetical protein
MYRIAQLGVLILETNDNFIMGLAVNLNFSEDFEKSPLNYKTYGGVLIDLICLIMFIDVLKEK